ncbi:MAG: NBR1-Ig-like domain-containing protein [Candidatus Electryonea clarkiae]|nr:NBR1-Ig-like domain-containing protein [Candidatus Electryonea clarkiae]
MYEIQTQAVATFSSGLTQTEAAVPTLTSTLIPTITPTTTYTSTIAAVTSTSVLPVSSCYSLAFLSDITIPDNTEVLPGQKFNKTWQVRNNGSCVWEAGFILKFTSGNLLGSTSLSLSKNISPGTTAELSMQMTAPSVPGNYQGNWRMTDADGEYFGDEIYVLIIVLGSTTSTPAPPTSSPTVSVTETQSDNPDT